MGVEKDEMQAIYWYEKSAQEDNAEAQYNLGLCYEYGVGVELNRKQSLYWYRKSANQGNKKALDKIESL